MAVLLGQLGNFVIPPLFKSIFFSLFVFTIGYKSGPEFFASLSLRTLSQVGVALVVSATGLTLVLVFAFAFHLDPGTAAGLASGSLTQSSMIGTATGALAQLGLADDVLRQQQANIAAGYAVTYILGYILTLLFVPFAAPWLMGVDLKEEAAKLEATLSGGKARKAGSLGYQKFKARAYRVVAAAGQTVGAIEDRIGQRVVFGRIVRHGSDVESKRQTVLESGDEIVLAGPASALIKAGTSIGPEIEGAEVLREISGDALGVLVTNNELHGRTLSEIADRVGDAARGVFLRDLTRRGQEVPLTPETTIYVGDVMTLVGATHDVERAAAKVGQVLRYGDRTDIAFLAAGIAAGLLIGLLSFKVGSFAVTLGGAGGTLLAGTDLRLAAYAPADRRKLPAGRAANAKRHRPRRIHRGHRARKRPSSDCGHSIPRPAASLFGHRRYARSADDRDHRGASHPAPESGDHLWRARGSDDGGCGRHRELRTS